VVKTPVKKLVSQAVNGADADVRRSAVIQLGYEDESVFGILADRLEDDNPSVQHAAVISLGRLGKPEAIDELVKPKVFHSPVTNIRWAAVSALGKLGDHRIIDHLIRAVDDPEWIVRNQAVTELKDQIRGIIRAGRHCYGRILLRMLALEDEEVVELAINGFCEMKNAVTDFLIRNLGHASSRVRENVVETLGRMNCDEAVPVLIERMQDEDRRVRGSAARALGRIQNKDSVEPLVQGLRDNAEDVQTQSMEALTAFGQLATLPLLKALTYEKNKYTLRAMILTLGLLGDLKAVPALINHLRSSYFVVRIAAVRALTRFGPNIINQLIPALSFNRSNIRQLLKDAESSEPALQKRAVDALAGLEDHRAVGLLKQLLEEADETVQDAAVKALTRIGCAAWGRCGVLQVLAQLGEPSLVPYFIHSLEDDSDNVRLEALRALAKVNGPDSIQPMIQHGLTDRDPYIRFEAFRLLRRVGAGYSAVLEAALAALKDPSRDVRAQASRLLGIIQDKRSITPLLRKTADRYWGVRESAENALMNFGTVAVPPLIEALQSKSWTTRFRAARLLGEIGDQIAARPLKALLERKNERKALLEVVERALEKLAGRTAA